MNGKGNYGIDMLRKIALLCSTVFLCSCNVLPGMQNPDISTMPQRVEPQHIQVNPTLIPINSALIQDQRISMYIYRVAPADVLEISVWQHPEFNIQGQQSIVGATTVSTQGAAGQAGYLVNAQGDIYFPLIGYMRVENKTTDAIRADISGRLRKYVKNPQVYVRVADFRGQKVYVFGEVLKPGFLPLNDQPLTITDALTLSGSFNPNAADTRHIYVIRGSFVTPCVFWLDAKTPDALLLAEHFDLQPGDILYVSSAAATRFNRVLNELLPTLQTIWYTKTITNFSR